MSTEILTTFKDVVQLPGNSITDDIMHSIVDDVMRMLGITMAYSHVYSLSENQMGTRP